MMRRRILLGALACGALPLGAPLARAQGAGAAYDVAVVGAGIAGFAAAIAAREAGAARVIILEKGPMVGGHSVFAAGSLAFVDDKRQSPENRGKDSVELFVADAREVGGTIDEAMVRRIAAESGPALDWLESMGAELSDVPFRPYGGMRERAVTARGSAGAKHYIFHMNRKATDLGVEIRKNAPVTGLERQGAHWQLTVGGRRGQSSTVAAKTVVLATGGFSANAAMRSRYNPEIDETLATTANPQGRFFEGATGDGHRLASGLGAELVNMDAVLLLPYWGGRLLDFAGGELYIDANGQRFVNETLSTQAVAGAIAALPEKSFFVITDSQSDKGANFGTKLAMGGIHKSDTVDDMALAMGIAPAVLKATLARYNEAARTGRDPDFGRTLFSQTIDRPPFYWGREHLLVHGTLGGVRIDTACRVLKADGSAIAGLFAAGEVAGGIWGRDRMGGTALLTGLVQGRDAGRNAAALAAGGDAPGP